MANPANKVCTANTWVNVATNVTDGTIINKDSTVSYIITTRETGQAAPTLTSEGRRAFVGCIQEVISSTVNRDVYIYAYKNDGRVEVTL